MSYRDYATVTIEVASISATSYGQDAGYWQPDGHGSVWQEGDPEALWAVDIGSSPSTDWETLPWYSIPCDQQSIETTTGFDPYGWNAEPGTLTAVLWDPETIYTPIGPTGTGPDDIGIDMPIRVKVTGPGKPWNVSGAKPFTILWAGFIRRIVHSISVSGQQVTTINATEVIGVYGRTNPVALTTPAYSTYLSTRAWQIHQRADKPQGFPSPNVINYVLIDAQQPWHPADDLHDNVWQEMCAAINLHGGITTQAIYPRNIYTPGYTVPAIMHTPVCYAVVPDPLWTPLADINKAPQVRNYCSNPTGPAVPMAIAPSSLVVTHALDGIANYIDLAVAGWDGSASTYLDQASMDRWGTFTYTRHDLKMNQQTYYRDQLGQRILKRLKDAVYSFETLEFPLENPRDLCCLVGAPTYTWDGVNLQWKRVNASICQPGEVWVLDWPDPPMTARLMLTGVAHSIQAHTWKVTIKAEAFNMNDASVATWPDAVPKALEMEMA